VDLGVFDASAEVIGNTGAQVAETLVSAALTAVGKNTGI
jgi:hypothetical protein